MNNLEDPRWLTDDAEERRRAVQAERDRKARELINAGDFDLFVANSVHPDVWRLYLLAVKNSIGDV